MAVVKPPPLPAAKRQEIAGYVRAAVGGAHFEIEHALELATDNQLADWLRQELSVALLDIEGVLQKLHQKDPSWT